MTQRVLSLEEARGMAAETLARSDVERLHELEATVKTLEGQIAEIQKLLRVDAQNVRDAYLMIVRGLERSHGLGRQK